MENGVVGRLCAVSLKTLILVSVMFCYLLSIICYVICYLLSIICYVICYPLFVIYYLLFVILCVCFEDDLNRTERGPCSDRFSI